MHSFIPRVESLSTVGQNIIDLNTNVLRFAMSEVILTIPRNALCAPLFMYQKSTIMAVRIRTACNILQAVVNMWCKYRVCIK